MTRALVQVLLGALVVLAAACSPNLRSDPNPSAGGSDVCEPVETFPIQGGQHLIGDAEPPVPYSSTPPTSGWHSSGAFTIGVAGADAPLTEPQQVAVLEAGGVVVSYRDLPAADVTAIDERAEQQFAGRVSVTPYDKLESGQVALTGWGVLQLCDELDLEVLDDFVTSFADPRPSVPGADAD